MSKYEATLNGFPYFNQSDDRWGGNSYGSSGTISSSGCGPTSMAMILKSYGIDITPLETTQFSVNNGYRVIGSGTSWGFFPAICSKYEIGVAEQISFSTTVTNLKNNIPIIASMGPGDFTNGGHFIVLCGITANGDIIVNDCAGNKGYSRSQKQWSQNTIKGQGKAFWAFTKNGQGSIGGAVSGAKITYTNFPKYNLSDSAIRDIATCVTGETGGGDIVACRQEASQIANHNEVTCRKSNTEDNIIKTMHNGWYASSSWSRGCTDTAIEAVKFCLVEGKRVLPRYVVEHDTFPKDILNAKDRSAYNKGDAVRNRYGSNYKFYCFFGSNGDGDIAGYFPEGYETYKDDIPWTEGANMSGSSSGGGVAITKTVEKSRVGGNGVVRKNPVVGTKTPGGITELYIVNHSGTIFQPVIEGTVTLIYSRKGAPTTLNFNVLKTKELDFKEGAQVIFKSKDVNMFYGFVFEKGRSKNGIIKVTAYDQLRYFKNKDCYVYSDKTATEVVKMIADDYNLVTLENQPDTGYKIPLRVEDNNTLFDIVQNAFDLTLINTGELYILYDDFGALTIRSPKSWLLDYVLDEETAVDFDYTTSIDNNVATRIKLYYDNETTGERETYIHNNEEKINEWGVLQHCDSLQEGEDGVKKAEMLSIIYKDKIRTLSAKDALGNPYVRAGCSIFVNLNLGDIVQQHFMMCETVAHKFSNGKHVMDITLIGGDFTE